MTPRAWHMPPAILAVILALSALQPLVHAYIRYAAPTGTVPTGLHIPDSALFLQSMDMFVNGFYSPFATCQAAAGPQSMTYYSVPHLWLYGVLGYAALALGGDPFLWLGCANGVGALLYLLVAYRLLSVIAGTAANRAFLLFALSAGPGGLLYLAAGALGWHDAPGFDAAFLRFALYDLAEGPHFQPVLYFPRLYYTLSLAGCLGGLTAVILAVRAGRTWPGAFWLLPVLLGSFLNARYTVFTFGLVVLFLLHQGTLGVRPRLRLAAWYAVPGAIGWILAALLMRTNPAVIQNHLDVGNMAMWIAPAIPVLLLPFIAGWPALRAVFRELPPATHYLAAAAWGYCCAYAVAYLVYQGYHGNLLRGHDAGVAAACSDPALAGAALGALVALLRPRLQGRTSPHAWVLLWLLGYGAISISGWGQGAFLQFGPQRLQVFLWLPLCMFAALGLQTLRLPLRHTLMAILLVFGVSSILVATFAFQGPLGRANAEGPYPAWHTEIMRTTDAALLAQLGEGTVLTPSPMGDVVERQRGNPVVFGIASFNLTDQLFVELRIETETFFSARTPDAVRRDIAKRWCVEWVLCPDTWPVDPAVRARLSATPWLQEVAAMGEGALYRVALE